MKKIKGNRKEGKLMSEGLNRKPQLIRSNMLCEPSTLNMIWTMIPVVRVFAIFFF